MIIPPNRGNLNPKSGLKGGSSSSSSSFPTSHDVEFDYHPEQQNLKFAWLMSFPNSGTSFTMKMTQTVSQRTTASNYGKEHPDDLGNTQVFADPKYAYGPYRANMKLPLPEGYILTKTHCGGRCTNCHPERYVETEWSFKQECLLGTRMFGQYSKHPKEQKHVYEEQFIQKAIHLIRNPFDNIVSRFHLHWNHQNKWNNTQWLDAHPRNALGFQRWCREADGQYWDIEQQMHYQNIPNLKDIPCHAEFFRYTLWHNRAFQVAEQMDLPVLMVHYEDYDEHFDPTISNIAQFLELEIVTDPPEYHRSNYDDYYSEDQRQYALTMIQSLATKTTWTQLSNRYHY